MLAATRLILWGLILGGPLAIIGALLCIATFSDDIHGRYTPEKIQRGYPKIMYKRALICLFLGLIIITVPLLLF